MQCCEETTPRRGLYRTCCSGGHAGQLPQVGTGTGHRYLPAIFQVWMPTRLEKLLGESQRGSDEHKHLFCSMFVATGLLSETMRWRREL